jgi:hypothetical protein
MIRWVAGLVAILPAIVVFAGVIAGAETPRKHSLIEDIGIKQLFGWPPNGHDVLRLMHQFDIYQMQSADSAAVRGDEALRAFALAQADLARVRNVKIARLNLFTAYGIDFPKQPGAMRGNDLAGLQGAVGQTFASDYYEKQKAEFAASIDLLKRYLLNPDNDDIRRFASEQLPLLQDGLKALEQQRAG